MDPSDPNYCYKYLLNIQLLTVLKKKGTGTVVLSTGSPSLGCDFFLGCWAMIGMLFKAWFTLAREAETETEMEATVSVSVQVRTDMMEALLFVYSIIMTTFKTVEVKIQFLFYLFLHCFAFGEEGAH